MKIRNHIVAAVLTVLLVSPAMAFTGGYAYSDPEGDTEFILAAYDESYLDGGVEKGIAACQVLNPEEFTLEIDWFWEYTSTTYGDDGDGDYYVGTTDVFTVYVNLPAAYFQTGKTFVSLWGNVMIDGAATAEIY